MSASLGIIGGIGGTEVLVVLFLVLVLFGPDKLPGLAKGMGKTLREFKKAASIVEEQIKDVMAEAEEADRPPVPRGPVAQPPLPPHKLPPYIPPVPATPPGPVPAIPPAAPEIPLAATTPVGPAEQPPPPAPAA